MLLHRFVSVDPVGALLIWDEEGAPPSGKYCKPLLWQGFAIGDLSECISILELIEENAGVLRSRYLAWVYDFGETKLRGLRLIKHLELVPGFSYWWMTLLNEKCNFAKSPKIDDAIKLLAFIDWVSEQEIESLTLVSDNDSLAECLSGWCKKSKIKFHWKQLPKSKNSLSWIRDFYAMLPNVVKAWIWLFKYLVDRWPIRHIGVERWCKSSGSITFVSPLFNVSPEDENDGLFNSDYWAHLPAELQKSDCKTNWLHLHVKAGSLSDVKSATRAIERFNKTGLGKQVHITLDVFLSLEVVFKVIKTWLQLVWKGVWLSRAMPTSNQEPINLWPLFKEDWKASIFGRTAMFNLLQYYLFKSALNLLPKQRVGVYLLENQGWEFGLVNTWKSAGHGKLVGFPHSTVRFWDLRYFFDPRTYRQGTGNRMPRPDHVAVSGQLVANACLAGGYCPEDLVEVEALRYLYLENLKLQPLAEHEVSKQAPRLIVFGDYLATNTDYQLRLLNEAQVLLPGGMEIIVKPHPACPINALDYPELRMTVVTEPIPNLLSDCDVAFVSAVTSAAVDAYCAGIPVVSALDKNTLNHSPLRGCSDVLYVSSHEGLAQAIILLASRNRRDAAKQLFFNVDSKLKLWRNLLM